MTDEAPKKKTLKQRLKVLYVQYGPIAVYTYLTLSLSAIIGFSIAIGVGVGAETAGSVLGVIGAGWVAAKATMPLRILATLGLTPLIANLLARRRKARGIVEDDDDEDDDDDLDEVAVADNDKKPAA